jgi:thiosulfate dehydrogenase [quinone] large subunit
MFMALLIQIDFHNHQNEIIESLDMKELSNLDKQQISNYYVAKVTPHKHSLVLPLGAKANLNFDISDNSQSSFNRYKRITMGTNNNKFIAMLKRNYSTIIIGRWLWSYFCARSKSNTMQQGLMKLGLFEPKLEKLNQQLNQNLKRIIHSKWCMLMEKQSTWKI